MRRRRRLVCYALGGLAVGAVLSFVVGRWFLKREVCSQLTKLNGAPVTVDQVQLGLRRHQACGIRLFQSDQVDAVWAQIERLSIELPVWNAVFGKLRPDSVAASGVVARVDFDAQGNLATRIPDFQDATQLPCDVIDVRQARLEIHRPDSPPLAADSIRFNVRRHGQQISVTGSVGEALGTAWSFASEMNVSSLAASGQVTCESLRIETEELVRQALLPAAVSELLRAEAVSSVDLQFSYQPREGLRYKLQASPRSLLVQLAQLDWQMTGGTGVVRVEDGIVSVDQLSGNTLGGKLSVSGQADLQQRPWRGQCTADISDLSAPQLLRSEPLQDAVTGQCSGRAEIDAVVHPDKLQLTVGGSGMVHDASFKGIRAEPINWRLEMHTPTEAGGPLVAGQIQLNIAVHETDIAESLRRLEIDPGEASGSFSLSSTVRVPLETVTDMTSYSAEGNLHVPEALLAGTRVRDGRADFAYDHGKLQIQRFGGRIDADGRVSGTGDVQVAPAGNLAARLDFDGIPGAVISGTVFRTDARVDGVSAGRLEATVAVNRVRDVTAWHVEGDATTERIRIGKLQLTDLESGFELDAGQLSLDGGRAKWHGASLTLGGSMSMQRPHELRGEIDLADIDVENIIDRRDIDVPIDVDGLGHCTGRVRGTLHPFSWNADGEGRLPDFAIGDRSIKDAVFRWKADASGLEVTEMRASMLGGEIDVAARLPLTEDSSGSHLEGSFRDLDLALLQDLSPSSRLQMGGRVSGEIGLTDIGTSQKRTGIIRFRGARATAYGATVDEIAGSVSYQAGQANMQLTGRVLNGTVGFRGKLPLGAPGSNGAGLDGRLQLRDAQLSRLWPMIGLQQRLGSVRAVAEGDFDVQMANLSSMPNAKGHATLRKASWGGKEVAPLAEVDIQLQDRSLRLTNMTCRIAGGTASGELTMRIGQQAIGTFSAALQRISIADLTRVMGAGTQKLEGTLDATVRGRIGPQIDGSGQLRVTNAKVAGVPISGVRMPIECAFAPTSGRARARARLASAQVAGGRVSGEADVRWTGRLGIAGKARFESVNVKPLARAIPMVDELMVGRVTGAVDLKGTNVRSFDDLSGSYHATLAHAQVLMLPILDTLTASLGIGSPASTTFSETVAQGHFGRGVIHVSPMTMNSQNVRMYIEGKLTLRGRVGLSVTADVPSLAVAGIVVGLLRPVDLLRRRLLFFDINGSIRAPIVQPRAAEFIQQEIILFFWPFVVTP